MEQKKYTPVQYPHLFSPYAIGSRVAPNRFVAQPMEGNDSNAGEVSQRTISRYRELAHGHWGIIIVEALSIEQTALARKNQLVLNREHLEGFTLLVKAIKEVAPETVVLFQITHSGRKSGKAFSQPTALYSPAEGEQLLTDQDIQKIQKGFIQAVLLAEEAGADGVDFKMCHGYFGSEMLRPANVRDDQWGGSFVNRTRFLREAVPVIKARLQNTDFILGARISYYEGIRGGCGTAGVDELIENFSEMDALVQLMEELQMDYVNVSAGIPGVTSEITRPTNPSKLLYLHQLRYAKRVKKLVTHMCVIGSAYSVLQAEALSLADENIAKGNTDFAGWGRQSLADPAFPEKISHDETVTYCKACSGCSKLMIKQCNVGCILYKPYYAELLKQGCSGE